MPENNKLRFTDSQQTRQEITNPNYNQLVDALLKGFCIVFFKKVTDGTTRQMKCTLMQKYMEEKYKNSRLLPAVIQIWKSNSGVQVTNTYGKKKYKKRVFKIGLLPVWDLEKQEWRSFYSDNVSLMIIDNTKEPQP